MDERVQARAIYKSNDILTKTIDDVLYLNSMLTFAVFIGLSQASPGARSLENRDECNAGPVVSKILIVSEVMAFAFFLSSSLSATAVKLLLRLDGPKFRLVRRGFDLKDLMFILTAGSTIAGIIMLLVSVVNLIQIQIGLYSCGSRESRAAILGVCIIVSVSLIMYVTTMSLGIYASLYSDSMLGREFGGADTFYLPRMGARPRDELV